MVFFFGPSVSSNLLYFLFVLFLLLFLFYSLTFFRKTNKQHFSQIILQPIYFCLIICGQILSTKSFHLLRLWSGVTCGCERVSSRYSVGAKLCSYRHWNQHVQHRNVFLLFLGNVRICQLYKAAVVNSSLKDRLVYIGTQS